MNSTRITTQDKLCHDSTQCHQCHSHIWNGNQLLPQRMRQDYLRWQLDAVDHFISPAATWPMPTSPTGCLPNA